MENAEGLNLLIVGHTSVNRSVDYNHRLAKEQSGSGAAIF